MYQKKAGFILLFLFFSTSAFSQVQSADTISITKYGFQNELVVSKGLSYFIDPGKLIEFPQIETKSFTIPSAVFLKEFNTNAQKNYYWLRFSIQNNTDSTLHIFLYCGDVNYINLYVVSSGNIQQKALGGNLQNKNKNSEEEQMTLTLPVILKPRESGEIYVKIIQKTPQFNFHGIEIYSRKVLDNLIDDDYYHNKNEMIWGLLFQGFVLCQILYVLFQWLIIRRKEYLYYFFYLLAIIFYFLTKQEIIYGEPILFSRFPSWSLYLNKTLQILPYFLYYRFVRYFLEIQQHYPKLNKWIIRIEYFLLAYLVFDFILINTTYNTVLQSKIFTYIICLVFVATTSLIIYLLKKKQTLIYFVLLGSLFAGIGNILGVIFTFLLYSEHIPLRFDNLLIFSQIGIVVEILCFTAGLSYKSKLIENEKSDSQKNLINQLKENQILNSKMQNIRNKIAFDLHDEIGSTLSSISILSDMALHQKQEPEAAGMIREIKENSIIVMERMDDIVWSINPINDSMEKLFLRIKDFAAKLFEAKGINYKIDIDENVKHIDVLTEYRQQIYLIMKEAINNLVKYSDCTEAQVIVYFESSILNLIIKDNGRGYDADQITYGNGLNSMKNRAKEMDAQLVMLSEIDKGTTIKLSVKID